MARAASSMEAKHVDLGMIRVVTDGKRDLVFLTHNNLKVFSLYCESNKPSRLRINKEFYSYDARQWDAVFIAYLDWKRKTAPNFKLPHFSGRTRDGSRHPWRKIVHPDLLSKSTKPPATPENT